MARRAPQMGYPTSPSNSTRPSRSCSVNQLRVLMTSAAYVLYQELRGHMAASELARAQVHTLRLKLVKISTQVVRSVRRIVLRMPRSCPSAPLWCKLARQLHTVGSG